MFEKASTPQPGQSQAYTVLFCFEFSCCCPFLLYTSFPPAPNFSQIPKTLQKSKTSGSITPNKSSDRSQENKLKESKGKTAAPTPAPKTQVPSRSRSCSCSCLSFRSCSCSCSCSSSSSRSFSSPTSCQVVEVFEYDPLLGYCTVKRKTVPVLEVSEHGATPPPHSASSVNLSYLQVQISPFPSLVILV